MDRWFVYVIRNPGGILYTGVAKEDVERRVAQHNDGKGARSTRGKGPWEWVYGEGPMDHADALRREMEIKRDKEPKRSLRENFS